MAEKQQKATTLKTIRIPLVGSPQNRAVDPLKDQRFVNFIPESNKTPINNANKIYLVKRAGLAVHTSPSAAAEGRGVYYYGGSLYSVFGDKVYRDLAVLQTLATTTGPVGWAESTGNAKALILCDGINGYSISAAGVIKHLNQVYATWTTLTTYALGDRVIPTTNNSFFYEVVTAGTTAASQPTWPTTLGTGVTDGTVVWECKGAYGGFPTPHVPTPIFMDGYIFLTKKDTADIYNCDLEMVDSWSSANFITAEMFPDPLLGLARQNNLVVAIGHNSTEFFFDSGSATGSPLARNAPMVQQFGTCAPYATFQNEKFCIIVGQSNSGGRAIWEIDGSTAKKISTEYIEKLLDGEDGTIFNSTAFGARTLGHFLYGVTLPTLNRTLVYDIEEKMWHEWASGTSGRFVGKYAADKELGYILLQHESDGKIYALNPAVYQDVTTPITCIATTSKLDFDSMNRKSLTGVYLIGDLTTTASNMAFRWSDDDYQTWSSYHNLDLSQRAFWARSGMFRRRAYQFVYTDNYPCRLEALEFDIRLGQH